MRRPSVIVVVLLLLAGITACGEGEPSPATTSPAGTDPTPVTTTVPSASTTEPPETTTTSTSTAPTSTSTTIVTTTTSAVTTTTGQDTEAPRLVVTDPVAGAAVTARVYRFRGETEPGTRLVAAAHYPVEVAADGSWSIGLVLNPGGNVAGFTATDAAGNSTTVRVPVYRVEPTGLVGETVEAVWTVDGYIQGFYVDGRPTGFTSGARLPIVRGDDGSPSHWLGFALRSDLGTQRGPYDRDLEGAFLLLAAGGESSYSVFYRVLDEVPFFVPASTGVPGVTGTSEIGVGEYAVRIGFTDGGPTVREAWRADIATGSLVAVDPAGVRWRDTTPVTDISGAVGSVVTTQGSYMVLESDFDRVLDLGGPRPRLVDMWAQGGSLLDGPPDRRTMAVGLYVDDPQADWAGSRIVWLEEMLAWDYGGTTIWWLRAELVLPEGVGSPQFMCWTDDESRDPVVARTDPEDESRALVAWRIDLDRLQFTSIDPSTVMCEVLGC